MSEPDPLGGSALFSPPAAKGPHPRGNGKDWRHFPFWLWVPWLRHPWLMSGPACEGRMWLDVQFFS
jgi:hypothetical protein